ncbi:putative acetyltransferase [Catalinimonas alkaloidigena]|uniref:GNAT family N-acetyltransferase n=1 Tax=Catalinimonas alkaloidigena TaxID=1075417 RepID=UPI0024061420|nr:GNAT family N-acetyltransferase [Catalinimonas alkaloidigena]MDF9795690.1 putative acetyltransferase [Catalinimonas alkaloidigena]
MTKKLKIKVRPATPDEQEVVTSLFRDTILNISTQDYSEKQVNAWAARYEKTHRWSDRIKHQYFIVAEHNKQVIGFGSATSDGYIDTLFVHKDHQGVGAGTTILLQLLDYITQQGRNEAHLDASITARSFFEKHGFRMIKPQQKVIDGVVFVNFMMVKNIER